MSDDALLRPYIKEACFPDFPSRVRFASVLDTPPNIFIFLDFLFRICLEVFSKQTPCRKGGGGLFLANPEYFCRPTRRAGGLPPPERRPEGVGRGGAPAGRMRS